MGWFQRIKDVLKKPVVLGSIAAGAGLIGAVFWQRRSVVVSVGTKVWCMYIRDTNFHELNITWQLLSKLLHISVCFLASQLHIVCFTISRRNSNNNSSGNTRINAVPGTVSLSRSVLSPLQSRRPQNVNPRSNTNRATPPTSSAQPMAASPSEIVRDNSPPSSPMQRPTTNTTPIVEVQEEENEDIAQNESSPLLTPQVLLLLIFWVQRL